MPNASTVPVPQVNRHKHTSVSHIRYHFVWAPKRRRKVLLGPVAARLTELLNGKCVEMGWEIVALEVMPDHVHLFLATGPDVSPAQVMHALKGYTSRILRQEFPYLNTLAALWTRSYWVSTASNVSSATIEKYISEQKTRD